MLRLVIATVAGLLIALSFLQPATDTSLAGKGKPTTMTVLQREAQSREPIDRRTLLGDVLADAPDAAFARWQAGHVHVDGEWRPVEQTLESIQDDSLHDEYRTRRQAARQNADDHIRLASWCRANGLPEQERAHLTAALALSGNRDLPQVRARLGHRLVNGRWMTRDEIAAAEQASREMLSSMKRWGRDLQNIAERLAGNRRQRDSATADLQAIDDPAALPAIEVVLTPAHKVAALRAVEWFTAQDQYQSSLALARQAAFSNWQSVRDAATQALKSRRWEDFMPSLLAAMHRPAESTFQVLIGGRGEIHFTYLWVREMADQWQVARYRIADLASAGGPAFGLLNHVRPRGPLASARTDRRRNDALRAAADDFHIRDAILEERNQWTNRFNARISRVLAAVTDQPKDQDPAEWWDWWVDRADVGSRPRRVVIVGEEERIILPRRDAPVTRWSPPPPPPPPPGTKSCLVAGTPVWTTEGAVPIERIRIGDQVLSKDIESGELGYKPVVLTTTREAPRIVRLTLGEETLDLTSGHLVWASGSGWTKARDLSSSQPLHTVTGTVAVDSVEPVGSSAVYNLVVADFHTYFFGDAKILSHDTTIPKLTNVVVPGLPPDDSHQPSE